MRLLLFLRRLRVVLIGLSLSVPQAAHNNDQSCGPPSLPFRPSTYQLQP
jgi:hypothetical protein